MQETFDVLEYIDFVRARWKFPAAACGAAILIALGMGVLLQKQYTSTATILIDPPAGGDARMATAVSNVYLESLKTYELLATNDQLFLRAAGRFHLVNDGSLKRRVLKVTKLRDTRALQISVTLPDPKTAQAMVQFLAEGAVELSRSQGKEAEQAMSDQAARVAQAAKVRLDVAERAWREAAEAYSQEAMRSEIYADSELKAHVEAKLLEEQNPAQIEQLQRRIRGLTRSMDEKSAALARQTAREQSLEATLNGARAAYDSAAQRLADLPLNMGSRSEWLRVLDPGIVPQQPSAPKVPLMLLGGVALALFGSLLYLTISFSLATGRRRYHPPLRMTGYGND